MYNLHCFVKSSVGLADPTHVDAIHGSAVLAHVCVVVVHLAAVIAFPHLFHLIHSRRDRHIPTLPHRQSQACHRRNHQSQICPSPDCLTSQSRNFHMLPFRGCSSVRIRCM